MKPSVVFLQEQLRAAAGTERISTGVMNELADRGYQVVIVLFGTDKTSAFPLNDKIKILLISVGRLVHTKGFDILLDIWGDISKRHSDWILQIVGSGEEKENLRKKIEELHLEENVQMIPTVKNIEDYYIDASIYVSAARLEPWGLVLAEAKSFGLPIVCFDCPHGPKNIVRDGMDGNLIALNDCNEMKEKILLLMDDLELRRKYGEAARKDFECRFSKRAIFNKWTELLK